MHMSSSGLSLSLYSSCVPDRTTLPFDKILSSSFSCLELTADVYSVLKTEGHKGAQEENKNLSRTLSGCICSICQPAACLPTHPTKRVI